MHTETFAHRHFYTKTLLHTDAFTHRRFYTQTLLHTQTRLHTDAFTHRSFYTQKLLHTETFSYRRFYTQQLLHTDAFTHKAGSSGLGHRLPWVKKCGAASSSSSSSSSSYFQENLVMLHRGARQARGRSAHGARAELVNVCRAWDRSPEATWRTHAVSTVELSELVKERCPAARLEVICAAGRRAAHPSAWCCWAGLA